MTKIDDSNAAIAACFAALPVGVAASHRAESVLPLQLTAQGHAIALASLLSQWNLPLRGLLRRFGALLFRGFAVDEARQFSEAVTAFGGEPLEYDERSTPRTRIDGALYTATEYPAREPIFLHNENAYASKWPRIVAFFCEHAAESGGAMTLADTRDVHARIPDDVRRACERRGLLYSRRFIPGVGYSWQQSFGVNDAAQLARVLDARGYRSYPDGEQLVVERMSNWTVRHPETSEALWFNHGVFFNAMSLPDATRRAFEKLFGSGVYPFQTAYADGTAIDPDTYTSLRGAYEGALCRVRLQRGDVLIVDNLLVAHGRDAYEGMRKHYVTMLG
ncbi:TauD/TfdA family dioxygenase [Burkholderia ubonensis]|nr:TauD/TfdA family dioxygenase [Burkholderia ubonensis]